MAYEKQTWTPADTPPTANMALSASRMNHIEDGIAAASLYREGTVAGFQANAATGTVQTPANINDNDTGTYILGDAVDEYAEVDFGKVVELTQWRQFGNTNNNGDGSWKIQYYNLSTRTWTDWVTGIATRTTADWSTFCVETAIVTDKIRLVCTAVDSGASDSLMMELEVKY